MNGYDYTSRLNDQKSRFQDAYQEQKSNHQKEIDDLKSRHEAREKKIFENHQKAQREIEQNTSENIENRSEEIKKALEQRKEEFNKALTQERSQFEKERSELQRSLDNRLKDVKSSYQTTLEQREKGISEEKTQLKDRFQTNIGSQKENFDKSLEQMQKVNEERFAVMQERNAENQKRLVEQKRMDQAQMIKDQATEDKIKDNIQSQELNSLRSTYSKELQGLQERMAAKDRHLANKIIPEPKDPTAQFNEMLNTEIEKKKDAYRSSMQTLQEQQNDTLNRAKTDYANTLGEVKESYDRSMFDETARNEAIRTAEQENFEKRNVRNEKVYESNIKDMNDRTQEAIAKTKDEFRSQTRGLQDEHLNAKNQLVTESNLKRNVANTAHQKELNSLRDVHQTDQAQRQKHYRNNVESILGTKNNEIDNLKNNFEKNAENMTQRNIANSNKVSQDFTRTIQELNSRHAQESHNTRREFMERMEGGTEIDRVKQNAQKDVDSMQNKVNNTTNKMDELKLAHMRDRERINEQHLTDLRESKRENEGLMREKDREVRRLQTEVLAETKKESNELITDYKSKLRVAESNNEEMSVAQRNEKNKSLQDQRVEFGRTINELTEKKQEVVNEMQASHAKDKTNYIENTRIAHQRQMQDLREELTLGFERQAQSFRQQIDLKEQEIKSLTEGYEQKISNLQKKTRDEIETYRRAETERKNEDMRIHRREMEARDRTRMKEMMDMRASYESKIAETKNQSNLMLAQLTETYEDKLAVQNQQHTAEMNTKLSESENNYRRLYDQTQMEKDALVQQYEMRLEKMRMANQVQQEKIKNRSFS